MHHLHPVGQIQPNLSKGGENMSRSSNTPTVPSASSALNNFKMEVANELGIANYDQIDKGQLSSRQNGYVGGNMTRKMVAFAEQALAQGQTGSVNSSSQTIYSQQGSQGSQQSR